MHASERAAEIKRILASDKTLATVRSFEPNISEIPLPDGTFGLMLNFFIRPEAVSMELLWQLNVAQVKHLHKMGKLKEFAGIESRTISALSPLDAERIVTIYVSSTMIDSIPVTRPDDLLSDWTNEWFRVYWYTDRSKIARFTGG